VAGREDWIKVAQAGTDEVRESILTGYKDGKPFTPYVPTLRLPAPLESVLDFGCGLGRNFPYLKRVARSVAGFDLPPMVERCQAAAAEPVDLLSADWDALKRRRFDLVFASLVLQHIEPEPLRAFLRDFTDMTSAVYVLTRTNTDFGEHLFEVLQETRLFDTGECVEVDHDPVTHQLRVLDRTSFEAARATGSDRHFEVLLAPRSRVHPPP
jgi:SAM-dependent methyltransferase